MGRSETVLGRGNVAGSDDVLVFPRYRGHLYEARQVLGIWWQDNEAAKFWPFYTTCGAAASPTCRSPASTGDAPMFCVCDAGGTVLLVSAGNGSPKWLLRAARGPGQVLAPSHLASALTIAR